ncbi:MAG TPA: diguanylate cyclase [Dongiaceae bacterium]|nr:diguanylate cyclase [Dongiaceae bacterium]
MSIQNKQTVLVIDDEPLNIKVLSQALSPWYRVKAATSGVDGIRVAASDDPPDLILLDIAMPGMDGYEVCDQLKANHATKEIPIIFITARNSTEDEASGLERGAVDYITKPFSLPIVMARIRNQLLLKIKTDMLEQLVSIDSLTEVANRRRFDEVLDQEWRRSVRNESPLSIVMIDVDYFKALNDSFGHAAGDICLKQIALALKNSLRRSSDTLARYGGEEFAAILPNIGYADALKLAEQMRQNVESLAIPHPRSPLGAHVTVSLGLTTALPNMQNSPTQLLRLADEMLYQAKQEGRNRVKGTDLSAGTPSASDL